MRNDTLIVVASIILGAASTSASAAPVEHRQSGQVASVRANILMVMNGGGAAFWVRLGRDTEVFLDGQPCQTTDLKGGMRIRLYTAEGAPALATRVEAIDKYLEFENTRDGELIGVIGRTLEMVDHERQVRTRWLSPDAVITCDGKACRANDLREGMRLRVTIERTGNRLTTIVEAIDRDRDFKSRD